MRLAASLIVRNELGRYLEPCTAQLREFCDVICVLDDGSEDGTRQWLAENRSASLVSLCAPPDEFFAHEGRARQRLLDWTLEAQPTHVLAIDADEFVSDGPLLRRMCEQNAAAFRLEMVEVWKAFDECLCVRVDGGWRPHRIPALWRVPAGVDARWRIADRQLACGRVPQVVDQGLATAVDTPVQILHFGWANEVERQARHHRYAVADGGRFHQSHHLDSILWPDDQVAMQPTPWPATLEPHRDAILDRCNREEHAWQA